MLIAAINGLGLIFMVLGLCAVALGLFWRRRARENSCTGEADKPAIMLSMGEQLDLVTWEAWPDHR